MPETHAHLVSYLAQRDEPCPRCGYNLRALTGSACPECGSALRLKVGLVEPRLGAFIMLLGSSCLGFGGALLFSLLVLIYAGPSWYLDEGWFSSLLLLVLLLTTGAVVPVLAFGRRLFTRRGSWLQWALAGLSLGYVLLMFALILAAFDG